MLTNDTRNKVKSEAAHLVLYYFVEKGMITTGARS